MGFLSSSVITIFIIGLLHTLIDLRAPYQCQHPFDSIYQFGDSHSDTGNLLRELGGAVPAAHLPYGETFFGKPTGRFSDGRILPDRLATALKLPLLNPYLDKDASFVNGVVFAVAGSTALNVSFLIERGIPDSELYVPLTDQVSWFKKYLESTYSSSHERLTKLRRSLVVFGEIGTNDMSYGFTNGKSLQQVRSYVPFIVQAILINIREIIEVGANRIVVMGNYPNGCFPVTLLVFSQANATAEEYDEYGCSRSFNKLTLDFNAQLQNGLTSLRLEFPHVTIVYADIYHAFYSVLNRARTLDFTMESLVKACCGIGDQYNYNGNITCGSSGVPVCPNPSHHIHWDGIHLTEEAYYQISKVIFPIILPQIGCF